MSQLHATRCPLVAGPRLWSVCSSIQEHLSWAETCGFEFGTNIPLHLQEFQDIWQLDLHNILQKSFPDKNSENCQWVAFTTTSYHALLAVIKPSHPRCHEYPSSVIGEPPSQDPHENVSKFWACFHDQGFLDTVFLKAHFDPSSKHAVDRFI
jgi:hypothetical protein